MGKGLPYSMSRGPALRQEIIKQVIKVDDVAIVIDGASGVGFGSAVIGDFPKGNILLLGAVAYLSVVGAGAQAGLVDTWSGDFGIGTTPAGDATITGTDVDIIPSTGVGPAVAEVSPRTRGANGTQAMFDNTDNSLEINCSVLVDDLDISADGINAVLRGELYVAYIVLGDDDV